MIRARRKPLRTRKGPDDAVTSPIRLAERGRNTAMSDMIHVPVNLLDDKSVTDAKAAFE